MKISKVVLGMLQTNTYILVDELSGLGAVIDPALYLPELVEAIEGAGITKLAYILLTHGHSDHILGVFDLKQKYPEAQVVIGAEDDICLRSTACSLASDLGVDYPPMNADKIVDDGDILQFGSETIEVVATPGHTPGGVCYIIGNSMFSGDTLFYKSVGRTDLFRGNLADLRESLVKLGKMKGDFIVYPGHGPTTTLDTERKTNRLMRKIEWSLM
ncbi:MAG: MBL fold metallo-hydrolase [Ruminococcaceae bacterium]|nr:MBL fold metallo-hydrolase [Oscillospiraceae bacterium]